MPKCSSCACVTEKVGRCSACNKEYMRKYNAANIERNRIGQRDYYIRNSDKVKTRVKAYVLKNPEKVSIAKSKAYDANKKARRATIEKWQSENKERFALIQRTATLNRIARKRNAEGKYTVSDVRHMYDVQNGKCKACKCSLLDGYHVDHINPLSKGGSNWPSNLQLLCPSCNVKKSAMTMEEFMKRNALC